MKKLFFATIIFCLLVGCADKEKSPRVEPTIRKAIGHFNKGKEYYREYQDAIAREDRELARKKIELAKKEFIETIKIIEGHTWARIKLAQCYFFLFEFDKAIVQLNIALERHPEMVGFFAFRGECHYCLANKNLAQKNYSSAITNYQEAIRDFKKARDAYKDACKINPRLPRLQKLVEDTDGWIDICQKELAKAIEKQKGIR